MARTTFQVFITTCNNPEQLRLLLAEIARQQNDDNYQIDVSVIDNKSTADYDYVHRTFKGKSWIHFESLSSRHGDGERWKIWNRRFEIAKNSSANYFVFLDDHAEICSNFFSLIEKYWHRINAPAAMLLDLLPENPAPAKRRNYGELQLCESSSLSPLFCCIPAMLKTFGYSIPPCADPVKYLGEQLCAKGMEVLSVADPFIRSETTRSRISPVNSAASSPAPSNEAKKQEAPVKAPPKADPIIFSLASMPNRVESLKQAIEQMLPQVDQICVYLNCYEEVPAFLNHEKIEIARSQDHDDQGARGKLWFVKKHRGYHIIGDDDLSYPPDYAQRMVAKVEQYQRRAVVALHGYDLPTPFISYAKSPKTHNFQSAVAEDCLVDIVGTGMMAFHSDLTPHGIFDRIGHPNMVDPYFALWARENGIPFICIEREKFWLKQAKKYPAIYDWVKTDDSVQTALCKKLLAIPRIIVVIPTFNRPKLLLKLLRQIKQMRPVGTCVFINDDYSSADYAEVCPFIESHEWITFHRHSWNYGKKEFWQTINEFLAEAKMCRVEYMIALQDDNKLCSNFFVELFAVWNAIRNKNKAALNIVVDDLPRTKIGQWGAPPPKRLRYGNAEVDDCGWFDGEWMMNRAGLEAVNYTITPIPKNRWKGHPARSAGDGEQLSRRIRKAGFKVYRPIKALVKTVPCRSEMHKERTWHANMVGFEHDCEKITVSLASIPSRSGLLRETVSRILPQCDRLNVYLNNYSRVPDFLNHAKITVARSQDHGDISDNGKFFWTKEIKGYHFSLDDDVLPIATALEEMVEKIDQYNRKAIIGIHGSVFPPHKIADYFRNRKIYHFVTKDTAVHGAGTGFCGFHTEAFQFDLSSCPVCGMTDVWFAIEAKKQGVPIIVVDRTKIVTEQTKKPATSLYRKYRDSGKKQTDLINEVRPWPNLDDVIEKLNEEEQCCPAKTA